MTRTEINPFCITRTPFDIVVNALFDDGYIPERSLHKLMFYKYAHILGSEGSPDMISSALDVSFHDYNEGYLPGFQKQIQQQTANK